MKRLMVAALAAMLTATSSLADNRDITSPDGRVVLTFDNDYGVAFYSVMVDGQYLIHPSRLGIKTANWSYSEAGPANIQTNSFFHPRAASSAEKMSWSGYLPGRLRSSSSWRS